MKTQGFSIVELVMVVVIVGILAVFAVPNYNKNVLKTKEKVMVNNLKLISAAIKLQTVKGELTSGIDCTTSGANSCLSRLNLEIVSPDVTYNCNDTTSLCFANGSPLRMVIHYTTDTISCWGCNCPSYSRHALGPSC